MSAKAPTPPPSKDTWDGTKPPPPPKPSNEEVQDFDVGGPEECPRAIPADEAALRNVLDLLIPLDEELRARVLRTCCTFFGGCS